MNPVRTALALTILAVSSAAAQDRPATVTLSPPELPRWDVAGMVAWLNVNKSGVGVDWNNWYDAGSSGAIVGYHWTPHLKSEVEVATSSEGTVYSELILS